MRYPQVLLLPLMMFADYFMTVLGAIEREKGYSRHFSVEHYELNPVWQKSIGQKKWFNPRHILLTIVLSSVLAWLVGSGDLPDESIQALLGALFMLFGIVLGRHVNNLLLFRHLAKNPDQISGQVTMSHQLVLSISMFQTIMVMIPLGIVAAFSQSSFAVGGFLGTVLFLVTHLIWKLRARLKRPSSQAADVAHPGLNQAATLESKPQP